MNLIPALSFILLLSTSVQAAEEVLGQLERIEIFVRSPTPGSREPTLMLYRLDCSERSVICHHGPSTETPDQEVQRISNSIITWRELTETQGTTPIAVLAATHFSDTSGEVHLTFYPNEENIVSRKSVDFSSAKFPSGGFFWRIDPDLNIRESDHLLASFEIGCKAVLRTVVEGRTRANDLAHDRELIPGILLFESPQTLHRIHVGGDPGDNPFSGVVTVAAYSGVENSIESYRSLNINARSVGFSIGNGKSITFHELDDTALGEAMQQIYEVRGAIQKPEAESARIGGQNALLLTFEKPAPYHRPSALFHHEIFWVRIERNLVLEFVFVTDSPEKMDSLKDEAMPRIEIRKENIEPTG